MKMEDRIKEAKLLESDDIINEYFTCECSSPDHTVLVTYDPDIFTFCNGEVKTSRHPELTINIQLSPYLTFWKRLWVALKYVFNKKDSTTLHWDCCSIREEDIDRLLSVIEAYKEGLEEIEEEKRKCVKNQK